MTSNSDGQVVRLHGDRHGDIQELLPWYVTDQLDTAEQAQVEAHLETCAQCQADVAFQRRLKPRIAGLSVSADQGWAAMRQLMDADVAGAATTPARGLRAPWLGWAAAAAVAVAAGALLLTPRPLQAPYHVLGAAPAPPAGNLVVIFRPETTEKSMREILNGSHARLVDGPTAADAYILASPSAERSDALRALRARSDVVLAEPIDTPR